LTHDVFGGTLARMKTFFYAPDACFEHQTNPQHPESAARLQAIHAGVTQAALPHVQIAAAPPATQEDLARAHNPAYIADVFATIPAIGFNFLDDETVLSPQSGAACLAAVGAVQTAIRDVLHEHGLNAFCAIRPPGHHAKFSKPAGFCVFNNVALGALYALTFAQVSRVAILDFDVHHGDGTEDIVKDNPHIFFASTYQYPLDGADAHTESNTGCANNILNIPLTAGITGDALLSVWQNRILPAVAQFKPDIILVSAGFDGHAQDPLADWQLQAADYGQLMHHIKTVATEVCEGRLVAVLEGGYDLESLAQSVCATLKAME
jgi:acetoin utilization deacetylase AcuC-like enzyme